MSRLGKLVTRVGLIVLFSAVPLAQMGNGSKFTAQFPFYVGTTLMPSGFSLPPLALTQNSLHRCEKDSIDHVLP